MIEHLCGRDKEKSSDSCDDRIGAEAVGRRLPIDFQGNLCGLPGFTDVTDVRNPQTGLPWSLVDVFTHMLQEQGHAFATQGARVTDISGTPAWPASPFVQPLEGAGDHNIPQDEKDSCGYFKWTCVTR
ncbi:MAG: hypothetical protein WCZ87_14005 [Thiohalobacteraceae bacterium]